MESSTSISFFVAGQPAPGGSKRVGLVMRKEGGRRVPALDPRTGLPRTFATDMSGARGKTWRADVRQAATQAMGEQPPLAGALALDVTFTVARPKSHFRANGILRPTAPLWPVTRPDATKLLRALEDALIGLVFIDDSQVIDLGARKLYGVRVGAWVEVNGLEDDDEQLAVGSTDCATGLLRRADLRDRAGRERR